MRRIAPMALIVCSVTSTAGAVEGTWTAEANENRDRSVCFSLSYRKANNMGMRYDLSSFTGLPAEAIQAENATEVKFALDREAGRVSFEGSFKKGKGSGSFTFQPYTGYFDAVRALGVDVSHRKDSDPSRSRDEQLLFFALIDLSTDYIRRMIAEGYEVTLEKYQNMRLFDVSPAHVREMRSLGFRDISASDLVATRIHGITPEFVQEMRAAGWDLSLSQLQNARIFNVTPEFRDEMAQIGYHLSLDKLTAFRIHGVTPEWIAELKRLGYGGLSASDLVSTRIFRVTPEFIRSLEEAGYRGIPMRELISMRVHGLDARSLKGRAI